MEQKKEQRHTFTFDFPEGVNRNTKKKKSLLEERIGKNAFGKYRELRDFVLKFIFKILCKKTAQSIQESHSLGNLTVASSWQFSFKLVCVPEVQLWPFKSTSNKCFKPIVLQLLEGKAVQHGGDSLELCSKACSVFGTAPVVSLAQQTF